MITLKRLNFTLILDAMLCTTARHAIAADGAQQQALDEIAQALNTVAGLIARHRLADQLNGPIPPAPETPHDGPDKNRGHATANGQSRTAAKDAILAYIQEHGSATVAELADHLPYTHSTIGAKLSALRRHGCLVSNRKRPATYYRRVMEDAHHA